MTFVLFRRKSDRHINNVAITSNWKSLVSSAGEQRPRTAEGGSGSRVAGISSSGIGKAGSAKVRRVSTRRGNGLRCDANESSLSFGDRCDRMRAGMCGRVKRVNAVRYALITDKHIPGPLYSCGISIDIYVHSIWFYCARALPFVNCLRRFMDFSTSEFITHEKWYGQPMKTALERALTISTNGC